MAPSVPTAALARLVGFGRALLPLLHLPSAHGQFGRGTGGAKSFCEDYTRVCGAWPGQSSCTAFFNAAIPGITGFNSGATQACYLGHFKLVGSGDAATATEECLQVAGLGSPSQCVDEQGFGVVGGTTHPEPPKSVKASCGTVVGAIGTGADVCAAMAAKSGRALQCSDCAQFDWAGATDMDCPNGYHCQPPPAPPPPAGGSCVLDSLQDRMEVRPSSLTPPPPPSPRLPAFPPPPRLPPSSSSSLASPPPPTPRAAATH
jgi:hypothetical protein